MSPLMKSMKKTLLTLLIPCAFSVNAAYEQAHDPHVVGTLPKVTCQTTIVEPPVPPGEVHNPDGYYDSALNKTGDELKAALNAIISTGITKLPYTDNSSPDAMDVWKALGITDEDPNNSANVILMYTGRSQEKSQRSGQVTLVKITGTVSILTLNLMAASQMKALMLTQIFTTCVQRMNR